MLALHTLGLIAVVLVLRIQGLELYLTLHAQGLLDVVRTLHAESLLTLHA